MTVGKALLDESRRHLLEEFWPRLQKAVPELSEAELWHRVNPQTNSVANLLLHLNGNVRQWVISGLGGAADSRERSKGVRGGRTVPLVRPPRPTRANSEGGRGSDRGARPR